MLNAALSSIEDGDEGEGVNGERGAQARGQVEERVDARLAKPNSSTHPSPGPRNPFISPATPTNPSSYPPPLPGHPSHPSSTSTTIFRRAPRAPPSLCHCHNTRGGPCPGAISYGRGAPGVPARVAIRDFACSSRLRTRRKALPARDRNCPLIPRPPRTYPHYLYTDQRRRRAFPRDHL